MSVYMYILRYIVQCPVQRTVNSEHWISLFLCFANKTLQKDFVYLELYRASYNVYKYMNCNINISGYLKLNFNLFFDRNICTALLFANQKQNCWGFHVSMNPAKFHELNKDPGILKFITISIHSILCNSNGIDFTGKVQIKSNQYQSGKKIPHQQCSNTLPFITNNRTLFPFAKVQKSKQICFFTHNSYRHWWKSMSRQFRMLFSLS